MLVPTSIRSPYRAVLFGAIVGALVLFAVLRLPGFEHDLWLDEIHSVGQADRPVWDVPDVAKYDTHPPLYYMLLSLWIKLGRSDVWVRMLSLLLGAVHILVMVRVVRHMGGRHAGVAVAFLLAASSATFWIATEARSWTLFNMLMSLAWLQAIRYRQHGRPWDAALLALWIALSCYTFYYAPLAAAALFAFFCVTRPPRRHVVGFGLALLVAGLAFLPWLPVFLKQYDRVKAISAASSAPPPASLLDVAQAWFVQLAPWSRTFLRPNMLRHIVAALVLGLVAWSVLRRRGSGRLPYLLATLVLGVVFAGLVFVGGRAGSFVHIKYLTFLSTVWCALAALTLRRAGLVVGVLALLIVVRGEARELRFGREKQYREAWSRAVAFVESERKPGDTVWSSPRWVRKCYLYYLPSGAAVPKEIRFDDFGPEGAFRALKDPTVQGRVFFAYRHWDVQDGKHPHERVLETLGAWGWRLAKRENWGNVSVAMFERDG